MKRLALVVFVILFPFCLFPQLTSGTDYSVITEVEAPQAFTGFVLYNERSESLWNAGSETGSSFSAKSEMVGFGYGLFFSYPAKSDIITLFSAEHMYRDITSSAVITDQDGIQGLKIPSANFHEISVSFSAMAGRNYEAGARLLHFSGETLRSNQIGLYGSYRVYSNRNRYLGITAEVASEGNEVITDSLMIHALSIPAFSAGINTGFGPEEAFYGAEISYLSFHASSVRDETQGYMNAKFYYGRSFREAKARIYVEAGGNISDEFSAPTVRLPLFYYNILFGTELIERRLNIDIGWNYGIYRTMISDMKEMDELNDHFNISGISDDSGSYKFSIKLTLRL